MGIEFFVFYLKWIQSILLLASASSNISSHHKMIVGSVADELPTWQKGHGFLEAEVPEYSGALDELGYLCLPLDLLTGMEMRTMMYFICWELAIVLMK